MLLAGGATGTCISIPLGLQEWTVDAACLFSCVPRPSVSFPTRGLALAPGSSSLSPGSALPNERAYLGVCVSQQNAVS